MKFDRRNVLHLAAGAAALPAVSCFPEVAFTQTRTQISIGTAGRGGFFYPLGTGIAAAITKNSGIDATAQVTGGAAENMKLLHEGKVELALAQADVAWSATEGKLTGLPDRVPVRTLFGTVSAYLHIVTLEELGINTVADLRGKRVSTGLMGTGTAIKALRVLDAFGVAADSLAMHVHEDYPEAAQGLKEGRLDAFAWDATLPGQAIRDLANTPGVKVRLLSTADAVPQMLAKHGPFYFAAPIPKGTYPGVNDDVPAAAGKTLFVTHNRIDESKAYEITKDVLEHIPELIVALAAAREISPTNAVLGSSIPFHSGALRYYRERGIAVPAN